MRSCILIFYYGGPSHLDSWDMKPHAPAEVRGEFRPIATRVPGLRISEHLPRCARVTDRLAIVRGPEAVHRVQDLTGRSFLLLHGPEPDVQWERFIAAVEHLVGRLAVRLLIGDAGFGRASVTRLPSSRNAPSA